MSDVNNTKHVGEQAPLTPNPSHQQTPPPNPQPSINNPLKPAESQKGISSTPKK